MGEKSTQNENILTFLESHPLQGLKVLMDPRPNTLLRSLVSPLQKQCGSLLSPLHWSESPPYTATLQVKWRELEPLTPWHEDVRAQPLRGGPQP